MNFCKLILSYETESNKESKKTNVSSVFQESYNKIQFF